MANESVPANGNGGSSDNHTPMAEATQIRPGGAPARVYLNEKVVPYLLEGMKTITRDQ